MPQKHLLAYLHILQADDLHEGQMEETMVPSIIICNTIMLVLASTGVFVKLLMLGHARNIGTDSGMWPNIPPKKTPEFQPLKKRLFFKSFAL